MIVSNPPYIDEADPHLEQGDVRFEPKTALVAADNGLPTSRISSGKDAVS
jgi:release factor glutamine methyltransferase